jgi:hypothetical protein
MSVGWVNGRIVRASISDSTIFWSSVNSGSSAASTWGDAVLAFTAVSAITVKNGLTRLTIASLNPLTICKSPIVGIAP